MIDQSVVKFSKTSFAKEASSKGKFPKYRHVVGPKFRLAASTRRRRRDDLTRPSQSRVLQKRIKSAKIAGTTTRYPCKSNDNGHVSLSTSEISRRTQRAAASREMSREGRAKTHGHTREIALIVNAVAVCRYPFHVSFSPVPFAISSRRDHEENRKWLKFTDLPILYFRWRVVISKMLSPRHRRKTTAETTDWDIYVTRNSPLPVARQSPYGTALLCVCFLHVYMCTVVHTTVYSVYTVVPSYTLAVQLPVGDSDVPMPERKTRTRGSLAYSELAPFYPCVFFCYIYRKRNYTW